VATALRIALLEPYFGGSHRQWAQGYQRYSRHQVELYTMPAQYWKWRMQGAALSFARMLQAPPDLILASGMMDVSTFRALTYRQLGAVPLALYLHENQLSYPQNRRQGHGWRYGFINYVSALCADAVYFNSDYHLQDFMAQAQRMLKHFPDYKELESIERIRRKAKVLHLGMDLQRFDAQHSEKDSAAPPLLLWNHRWEDDKDPDAFIDSALELVREGFDFQVAMTGQHFGARPRAMERAQAQLGGRLLQLGYVDSFAQYARLLWAADFVISSAWQEFFGMAICEAIYCGCLPILPRRLNYPALLPRALHDDCLYQRGRLSAQLRHHLSAGAVQVPSVLREHVARYDWAQMAARYDEELAALALCA